MSTLDLRHDHDPHAPVYCGNCEWGGTVEETKSIQDAHNRLSPGDEIPVGECPSCGVLAYLGTLVPTPIHTDQGFDDFLDDATHAVHNMWTSQGGRPLPLDPDLYALNDLLTGFFADKRPANNGEQHE